MFLGQQPETLGTLTIWSPLFLQPLSTASQSLEPGTSCPLSLPWAGGCFREGRGPAFLSEPQGTRTGAPTAGMLPERGRGQAAGRPFTDRTARRGGGQRAARRQSGGSRESGAVVCVTCLVVFVLQQIRTHLTCF